MKKVAFIQWVGLSLILVLAVIGFPLGGRPAFALPENEEIVTFPDPNLEVIIRQRIRQLTGPIYISSVAALTSLSAERGISNLSGLDKLTNLRILDLNLNNISDLSALAGLTNLEELHLSYNKISDISPLAGLTKLKVLDLTGNSISDLAALAGLTNLEELHLYGNNTSDISALAGLAKLKFLDLFNNGISDISALVGLTNLEGLNLAGNSIRDISALAGLTNLKGLGLDDNNISDISALARLTNLEWLGLGRNSIRDISALVELTILSRLELDQMNNHALNNASAHLVIAKLRERGVVVFAEADPDWYLIAGSFIPLTGVGFALICYLATTRRRKWLRPAAIVIGIIGAALMALWLLPNVTSFSRFETLSVPEGITVFLAIIACLIILISAAVAPRRELSGGILMIGGGLIAGVAYPLWLFHTASILTLFPLLSGFLYLLSWRERPVPIIVESIKGAPSPVQSRIVRSYTPVIFGIGVAGFIGLYPVLSTFILLPGSYYFSFENISNSWWELYFILLYTEAWCLALTCSILAARKYW